MKRTRIGVTAVLFGTAVLGRAWGGGLREAYPARSAAGCDLASGFATAALRAPRKFAPAGARAPRRSAATEAWIVGVGADPFAAARQGNLGLGAIGPDGADLSAPSTTFTRQPAPAR